MSRLQNNQDARGCLVFADIKPTLINQTLGNVCFVTLEKTHQLNHPPIVELIEKCDISIQFPVLAHIKLPRPTSDGFCSYYQSFMFSVVPDNHPQGLKPIEKFVKKNSKIKKVVKVVDGVKVRESISSTDTSCSYCGTDEKKTRLCGCQTVYYCSRSCKSKHKKIHQPACELMSTNMLDFLPIIEKFDLISLYPHILTIQ
jgi:hypothetical protein